MLSFSQRKGLKPIRALIQKDSVDLPLRNQLWNGIILFFWNSLGEYSYDNSNESSNLLKRFWVTYYELRFDERPRYEGAIVEKIKNDFVEGRWFEVYDILEFIIKSHKDVRVINEFTKYVNITMEKYLSAYRLINGSITDITSEEEIASIEAAINASSKYEPVNKHLTRALELLSNRESPDYRNSIKESISAVESYACLIANKPKATLGKILGDVEKVTGLHPSLKQALSSLYGWTSDSDGIRHKMMEESKLGQEDARFMLVVCSAFINYLKEKRHDE